MKPDRERTLGGRMRRIEPAAPGGEQGALKDEHDPFAEIKALAQAEAVRELGTALNEGEVVEEELHEQVQRAIDAALAEAGTPLSTRDRARLVREITHNILGYGPIEPFLADDTVTEVMVNNHSTIYVERKGMIEETDIRFGVRAPPAPGDRADRGPDRPAHRRVEPRWSTPGCPTARASTPSSRRWRSTVRP